MHDHVERGILSSSAIETAVMHGRDALRQNALGHRPRAAFVEPDLKDQKRKGSSVETVLVLGAHRYLDGRIADWLSESRQVLRDQYHNYRNFTVNFTKTRFRNFYSFTFFLLLS